MDVVMCIQNLR